LVCFALLEGMTTEYYQHLVVTLTVGGRDVHGCPIRPSSPLAAEGDDMALFTCSVECRDALIAAMRKHPRFHKPH
jgi:hypothetical protein